MYRELFMIQGTFCKGRAWENYRFFFEQWIWVHHSDPLIPRHFSTRQARPSIGRNSLLDYADDLLKQPIELAGLSRDVV